MALLDLASQIVAEIHPEFLNQHIGKHSNWEDDEQHPQPVDGVDGIAVDTEQMGWQVLRQEDEQW